MRRSATGCPIGRAWAAARRSVERLAELEPEIAATPALARRTA